MPVLIFPKRLDFEQVSADSEMLILGQAPSPFFKRAAKKQRKKLLLEVREKTTSGLFTDAKTLIRSVKKARLNVKPLLLSAYCMSPRFFNDTYCHGHTEEKG